MVYYNEFDPAAAAWLRELMAAGLIPRGVVDERSIQEVRPADVAGFSQCHFFGGVGGWAHALALAGWSGPVWTGSCPCQPFSPAGRRKGKDDARHLWPDFHRLIGECRPPVVFGEQVARRDGLHWLAGVRTDLEGLGYAVGAADLAAAGVGAPHIRQRLFWVADGAAGGRGHAGPEPLPGGVAGAFGGRPHGRVGLAEGEGREVPEPPALRDAGRGEEGGGPELPGDAFWSDFELVPCSDGTRRRTQPGVHPLAHGVSGRVGLIRGYGNAIVPQVAAAFVKAYMAARRDLGYRVAVQLPCSGGGP